MSTQPHHALPSENTKYFATHIIFFNIISCAFHLYLRILTVPGMDLGQH